MRRLYLICAIVLGASGLVAGGVGATASIKVLPKPVMLQVCPKGAGFCATFPADTDPAERMALEGDGLAVQSLIYDSSLLIAPKTNATCPNDGYETVPPACRGFIQEDYIVGMYAAHGETRQQEVRILLQGEDFTGIHLGSFEKLPAVYAEFHTKTGGYGPYIYVWKGGKIYSLAANGQATGARYGAKFLDSFHFTS